jgi:hypothetical protein
MQNHRSKRQNKSDPRYQNRHRHKKIEVIDVQTFMQHTSEEIFLTALKQKEDIEKKSQVYYLKAAGHKDDKTKKNETEQSYVPDDFEQRLKVLREVRSFRKREERVG